MNSWQSNPDTHERGGVRQYSLTFTIAVRFNRDSHKSPKTPTTQMAIPATLRPCHLMSPIEKTPAVRSPGNPTPSCDNGPDARRRRDHSRARAVPVPKTMAPVTPTQVLFGLATASRLGIPFPVAVTAAAAGVTLVNESRCRCCWSCGGLLRVCFLFR